MALAPHPLVFQKPNLRGLFDQPLLLPLALALLPGGAVLALLLLARTAWRGRIADALLGTVLLTLANPVLFSADPTGVGRWGIVILGFLLLSTWKLRGVGVSLVIAAFGGYLLWSSVFVSSIPTLSLFKGGVFVIAIWLLFNSPRIDWEGFSARLDRFIPLYVLLTLPVLFLPAIGLAGNGLGFQGLTNQPQGLGILLATFGVWLFARLWGGQLTVRPWVAWATLLALGLLIIESQARTALGGLAAGVALIWLFQLFTQRGVGLKSMTLAAVVLIGAGAIWTQTTIIQDVVFKQRFGGQREDLGQGIASRLDIASISAENFQSSPAVGIGFGMPSVIEDSELTREPVFNLPIAANVEKGVWVTAALEELGIIGFSLLSLMFLALATYSAIWRRPLALALLLTLLITALGENTLFSIGAMGLVQWLMFFAVLHSPKTAPASVPS